MTCIPERVDAAITASRQAVDVVLSEENGHLTLTGTLSRRAIDAWQAVYDHCPAWLSLKCIDAAKDVIQPREIRSGDPVRIEIKVQYSGVTPVIFSVEGWRALLWNDEAILKARHILLAFDTHQFSTRTFELSGWREDQLPKLVDENLEISLETGPRRYVRNHSPEFMPPKSILPWIVKKQPRTVGTSWTEWAAISSEMICRSLPTETFVHDGLRYAGLSGQPPKRIEFGNFEEILAPFDQLQDAAKWIYLEGEDVEVRHTFVSSELAREWTHRYFSQGLVSKLATSMASARLLYKAHLRAGSRETLKSLGDLRKSLADDVQKILQQARDLSNGVWRDVAIAIGVVAVRISVAGAGASNPKFGWVYLAVASYLAVSSFIIVRTNEDFLRSLEKTRKLWKPKLYGFLDFDDYRDLSDTPISEAISAYRRARNMTITIVLLVSLIIILLALMEFEIISYEDYALLVFNFWGRACLFVTDFWSFVCDVISNKTSQFISHWRLDL